MGVVFGSLLGTRNLFLLFMMLIQQQSEPLVEEWNMFKTIRTIGRRAKSVVGCKQNVLRVDGCCYTGVHVLTSLCCCELQPVVLRDDKWTEWVFMMLPRACFVLYRKTVEHRSGKSRDLLQTGEFTSGDKVTHFSSLIVIAFSVVACVQLHTCSFLSHPSLRTAQGGILILDVVSENIPYLYALCLSRVVIASAAIVVVLIAFIAIWIPDFLLYFINDWKLEIYGI